MLPSHTSKTQMISRSLFSTNPKLNLSNFKIPLLWCEFQYFTFPFHYSLFLTYKAIPKLAILKSRAPIHQYNRTSFQIPSIKSTTALKKNSEPITAQSSQSKFFIIRLLLIKLKPHQLAIQKQLDFSPIQLLIFF